MLAYLARRLLLMIPTLFGVMLVSFAIVQFVPGGPVERAIAQLQGNAQSSTAGFGGGAQAVSERGGLGAGGRARHGEQAAQHGPAKHCGSSLEERFGCLDRHWISFRVPSVCILDWYGER